MVTSDLMWFYVAKSGFMWLKWFYVFNSGLMWLRVVICG